MARTTLHRDDLAAVGGTCEFYADGGSLWFGPRPAEATSIDLVTRRYPSIDNLQILQGATYLTRVGRDQDAVRLFATQARVTLAVAHEFCDEHIHDPAKKFLPPPWRLQTEEEGRAAEAARRRRRMWIRVITAAVLAVVTYVIVVYVL